MTGCICSPETGVIRIDADGKREVLMTPEELAAQPDDGEVIHVKGNFVHLGNGLFRFVEEGES